MSNIPQLVVCGSIAVDRIMNFDGHYKDVIKPDKIHVLSLSVVLKDLKDTFGGNGGNICYSLALLGETPVLIGAAGKDASEYLLTLKEVGVDTSYVHMSDLKTASFTVMTDLDDNQVGGFYPGAMNDSDSVSFINWKGKNALATIAPYTSETMRRLVGECKDSGIRLFYDVGQMVANVPKEDIVEGLEVAELLILNDYELSVLCDKIQESPEAVKKKVSVVVTTKGAEGSSIEGKNVDRPMEVQAAKPAQVLDPTGAGDAYRAGFLYGYVRDLGLESCGRLGATVASFAIEHVGTQNHRFTKEEVAKRYKESFGKEINL